MNSASAKHASFSCACPCEKSQYEMSAPPLFRIVCHCTVCQRFNQKAYGDVLVFETKQLKSAVPDSIAFDTYKAPPNLQRGKCSHCDSPTLELFNLPLMPKLTVVPASVYKDVDSMPEPALHMFYDKRVSDINDDVPKYSGFLSSQRAFLVAYLKARFGMG